MNTKSSLWVIFLFQMRNYIRKTARVQNVSRENVSKAIDMVRNHNWGVVDAAREFKLSERSLFRYLKVSANKEVDVDEDSLPLTCGYSSRKIFTADQEKELVAYITKASDIYFGLSPMEVRKLAFSFATFLECKMPKSWESTSAAGKDWFGSFIKRNPSLSIRKPEATSLARLLPTYPTPFGNLPCRKDEVGGARDLFLFLKTFFLLASDVRVGFMSPIKNGKVPLGFPCLLSDVQEMLVVRRNLVDSTLALSQARDTVEILKTSAAVQDITVETTHNPIDAAQGLQDETQERSLIRPETQKDNEIRTGPNESENEQSMSDDEDQEFSDKKVLHELQVQVEEELAQRRNSKEIGKGEKTISNMEDLKFSATRAAAAAEAGGVAAEAALAAAQSAKATVADALKPLMDAAATLVEAFKALMANDGAAAAKCETMGKKNLGTPGRHLDVEISAS
uniref:HTH CENPB-type domain-containing protein n=1 Tax=Daphnia galeata TaxID=27404 RepID=A0A8J2S148_9CRUS|nr:unnamed protein product [Daphnia galeata]